MSDNSANNSVKVSDRWHTIDEACRLLGVSSRTIQRRIKKGDIESKMENGRRLVAVPEMSQDVVNMAQTELFEQLRIENDRLQQQLAEKDKQIERVQEQLAEKDNQIGQLHQLLAIEKNQTQRLLENQLLPFWRRWFKRKALPGPADDIVDMGTGSENEDS